MSEDKTYPKTRRMVVKGGHYLRPQIPRQTKTEIFPGLNDITDAFEALPLDIIRYFTLLKEIDAKCVTTVPVLNARIRKFKGIENKPELKGARTAQIREISKLIKDLLPCLEEKMHVASIAADKAVNYIDRINDDFELIFKNEIPESVKFGPLNHPAIINDAKIPDNKSVQSQRSESRREALAAKKAANGDSEINAVGRKDQTPGSANEASLSSTTATHNNPKKRKPATSSNPNNNADTSAQDQNPTRPSTPSANKRRATSKKKPVSASLAGPSTTNTNSVSTQSAVVGAGPNPSSSLSTAVVKSSLSNQVISNAGISTELSNAEKRGSSDEPLYCYCNQVSYGEMVGCDGENCEREWFHLPCIGLNTLPRGKWYCDQCAAELRKTKYRES